MSDGHGESGAEGRPPTEGPPVQTLRQPSHFEQDIRKSRFLAVAAPVSDEQEARSFIAAHMDGSANHNCWAFRIGSLYRFNDDGEPSGTAGKPILQAIDGQQLDRVGVIVTRWFGGILLGTGGLMRAYCGTAAACLKIAEKLDVVPTRFLQASGSFADLAVVKSRLIPLPAVQIVEERYAADGAEFIVEVPTDRVDEIGKLVADLTGGRVGLSDSH